jgi:predicted transcriptional regulator
MKKIEKDKARILRKQGHSMNEITRMLGVAKSSVSLWTGDIELTYGQKNKLSERGRSIESVERRRFSRLNNERAKRRVHFEEAVTEIKNLSKSDLFFLGIALYWGEGSKTSRGTVNFTNTDPRSIQIMMHFFKDICGIPDQKFHGHVILHPHLDARKAEHYWSRISGVPITRFQKTSMQHNRASQNKKDSLPYGTFSVSVYDTVFYLRLMGWMDGVYMRLIEKNKQIPCKFHRFL